MTSSAINLRILSALAVCASTEETRYYLKGVKVEITARHTTYVVTDGHRLMAHRTWLDDTAADNTLTGDFIIPLLQCKSFKLGKRDTGAAEISGDASRLTIDHGGSAVTFAPVDGSFPDWRRVIPAGRASGEIAQFNPKYLADFAKIGAMLDYGDKPWIAHNGDSPAFIHWTGIGETLAVLMPVRGPKSVDYDRPGWLDQTSTGAAVAMLEAAE